MSGLLAFISAGGKAAARRDAVADALDSLHHRGPHDTRVELAGGDAVLGCARLAVTDEAGSPQPMAYPPDSAGKSRYLMVFDGSLYNWRELKAELIREQTASFATEGDAEVAVAAYHHWGPGAVQRLRGMFAFVLWDSVARRAFGARDPFGVKPLYHLVTPDGVYIASEKKALLRLTDGEDVADAELDEASLSHYLSLQYVPEPGSMHRGIGRVGSGESFVYSPGGPLATRRYHQPRFAPAPVDDASKLYEEIRQALRDSVRANLAAEVPVGAFLSSGIDSTALVALAREVQPALRTFTVGYDVDGYSEIERALESARELGVHASATTIGPEDLMTAMPRIVWHLDDPVADPAVVPLYFLARAARREVSVVLSGEGADELFAGYGLYREPLDFARFSAVLTPMRRGLRAISRVMPAGLRGKGSAHRAGTPVAERYYGNARVFTDAEKARLLRHFDPEVNHVDLIAPAYAEAAGLDDVTTMQYVDLYTWLRGDILVKADRMSMAHGLQLRTPFLDPAVFASAAKLPLELKIAAGGDLTKYALRRALDGVVPPNVVQRHAQGFPTPIRVWLRDALYEWATDVLSQSQAGQLLDLPYARTLLEEHRHGRADHSRKVWTVLVFCLWHAIFVTGTIDPAPHPSEPPTRGGSDRALSPTTGNDQGRPTSTGRTDGRHRRSREASRQGVRGQES